MHIQKNIPVPGIHGRPIPTDIFYKQTGELKPVIIYAHGFNGFKDWGNFDLIARQFAAAGFVLIKFNFSHNGTTPDFPEEFSDLDAFAGNNYTIELDDLDAVIGWAMDSPDVPGEEADLNRIFLIGHSLGGGIVILKAAEDSRVKAISTWAAISECKTPWGNWPEEKIAAWRSNGVTYITNSRTRQEMPLGFQLYQNFQQNSHRLDIQQAIQKLHIPVLICHGNQDTSVPVENAYHLKNWQPAAELFLVESDHVFGRKHPWTDEQLPTPMQDVVNQTIRFFKAS